MQQYNLGKEWVKVDSRDNLTISIKQEDKTYSKEFLTYYYLDIENELTELVKKGFVRARDVSKVLCQDLSKHCSRARYILSAIYRSIKNMSIKIR
ncbi:protein canopy-1 [Pyrus ussuriensis x Pyrus communis]|uniref:Protein canopy-1 n=1 Tax=Pyrus ussuriensis x Pyrus communis TaxID=2448454 RepID=A0A5N5HQV0_9ROSA|nr:protein canopy-1 [Pyrus ussuriensis x Pyrus communis]